MRLNKSFGKSAVFYCLMAVSVRQADLVGLALKKGGLLAATWAAASHSVPLQAVGTYSVFREISSEKRRKLAFGFPL